MKIPSNLNSIANNKTKLQLKNEATINFPYKIKVNIISHLYLFFVVDVVVVHELTHVTSITLVSNLKII